MSVMKKIYPDGLFPLVTSVAGLMAGALAIGALVYVLFGVTDLEARQLQYDSVNRHAQTSSVQPAATATIRRHDRVGSLRFEI